jgi:hypothetical protein
MTDQRMWEIAEGALLDNCRMTLRESVEQAVLIAWREGMEEAAGICERKIYFDGPSGMSEIGYRHPTNEACAAAIRKDII